MKKLVKRFWHAAVYCVDIEQSVEFYRDVLGGEITLRWDNQNDKCLIAMVQFPEGTIELLQPYTDTEKLIPAAMATPNHIAFLVDDADKAAKHVEALGYKFERERVYPLNDVGYIAGNNIHIGFFHGPNGERIEFFMDH